MDLSIIVPVRNEAGNVSPLIDEIRAALTGFLRYEIIYVDDGSEDDTPRELAEAMSVCAALRVYRHAAACGQSAAVWTGARHARAPWIATLDGDGQNDPADLRGLWAAIRSAEDQGSAPGMVMGQRTRRHDSRWRRFASRIANGVRRRLLRDGTRDSGCGIKLMRRDAFLSLPFFDHMHRFLPALFAANGWDVIRVPVSHRPRRNGRSKYGVFDRLWVGIVDLFGVMWLLRRSVRPVVTEEHRG